MKALITGGAGFIGSHLAEKLLKMGDEVTVIDNLSTGKLENLRHLKKNSDFYFILGTVTNETLIEELISRHDIIYHLAAAVGVELIVNNPVEVIETNILGTQTALKIANRYKRKIVIISSSEIYGKSEDLPFKEDDDCILGPTVKSRWNYACSKAMGEFLALAYYKEEKLPVVILRLFNTIGPRQSGKYGMVVPRFIQQALANKAITVYGDGQQTRCFTYVTDVVEGTIKLANHPKAVGEVYNIGSNEEISIGDLALKIKKLTKSASQVKFIPYDQAYEKGFEDMRRRVPDISKIKYLIGYEPKIKLEEALKRIIDYFRKQSC
ncbi:Bifunctional polymyxin resistance protein ArnA [subsurface metagenome]